MSLYEIWLVKKKEEEKGDLDCFQLPHDLFAFKKLENNKIFHLTFLYLAKHIDVIRDVFIF